MFEAEIFGVTNGVITILALITGLRATNVNKIGIIGALLAMIIADPLSDAYSIYISEKQRKNPLAYENARDAFIYQALLQLIFLFIIIVVSDIDSGIKYCYIVGILITILYGKYRKVVTKDIVKNLFGILVIVYITYFSDITVYKYKKHIK
tara:strand:+ start:108 stop:560 length:453 start_codon:yes stop_codon:yes gene_type:complete